MVATWNPAAASTYYTRQRETDYYTDSKEPDGIWYAPAGGFGLVDGATVDRRTFEHLYKAIGPDGQPLLEEVRRHTARTPAFDVTLSAPRSVSLAWAFAPQEIKVQIESAQQHAVRATLRMLEREAAWARRGRGGARIERVSLSAATFQQGESRAAPHADGAIFGDPNLHTHCVILNLATRADGTVGALHSKVLRDFKMAAGATYHAELAHQLQKIGFEIDRIGKNGIFELAGVDHAVIQYFSARRSEIENELAEYGLTTDKAVALAAAISKATRSSKRPHTREREEVWREAARSLGIDIETFTTSLNNQTLTLDQEARERLLADRLAALPDILTEHESIIDRRELVRSVAAALVGTGLPIERASAEVDRLLRDGAVIEIGHDGLGLPRYSTPEMLRIEREIVDMASTLASQPWASVDRHDLDIRCQRAGLSQEQIEAVRAATDDSTIAIIEGAPGAGKTTTLSPIVDAYRAQGCNILGTATAWRVATMLKNDLKIESRATASWIARIKAGQRIMDKRTVLIADEAGLLSSREMHILLTTVAKAGAKLILAGDRQQLAPVGAGAGLDLVARAVEAVRIETIVRQREAWAREAVTAFGMGKAATALDAFARRGLLIEANGAKAAIKAVIDHADRVRSQSPDGSVLIVAKSNAAVAAISREIRKRLKAGGRIKGREVAFTAATPSGHSIELQLARGDILRFLVRNDDLGVINGSVGKVLRVRQSRHLLASSRRIIIEADVGGRKISFDPRVLADAQGRPRLAWAYASTIAGAQGMTVDHAIVLLDPTHSRRDCLVAASRARDTTTLVIDGKSIDRRLIAELPIDRQRDDLSFSEAERRAWLAERLSRAAPKISTLDVMEVTHVVQPAHARRRSPTIAR